MKLTVISAGRERFESASRIERLIDGSVVIQFSKNLEISCQQRKTTKPCQQQRFEYNSHSISVCHEPSSTWISSSAIPLPHDGRRRRFRARRPRARAARRPERRCIDRAPQAAARTATHRRRRSRANAAEPGSDAAPTM